MATGPPLAFPLNLLVPAVINDLTRGQLPPPRPLLVTLAPSRGYSNVLTRLPPSTGPKAWGKHTPVISCPNGICVTGPENPPRYNCSRYPASYTYLNCTYNFTHWCPVSSYGPVPLNNTEGECEWWEGNTPSTWSVQFNPPVGFQANSDLAYGVRPSDDASRIIREHPVTNVVGIYTLNYQCHGLLSPHCSSTSNRYVLQGLST